MKTVLVTGAGGFVGRALCKVLDQSGFPVRAALRDGSSVSAGVVDRVVVGEISAATNWDEALSGVGWVIHAAARVHVLNDDPANVQAYLETNAYGTRRLAEAAARAGVSRFVFLSSVKVNGERTSGRAFSAGDRPLPQDAYGESKRLGEHYLMEVAAAGSMDAVIVRPPLVYGPNVRANFLRLMNWVDAERPLPLGAVNNARSLVNIWNLCDLLVLLLQHPNAARSTWMVSDGQDLSTPDLIRRIGVAMHRRVRLLPVPVPLLRLCGAVLGQRSRLERLCGSLTVDIEATRQQLGWIPPVSVDEALRRTAEWYFSGPPAA